MSYYRGDYYRGDYYRGDPFLGAIVGRAGAALGKLAVRAVSTRMGRGVLAGGAAAETARRYIESQRPEGTSMPGGSIPQLGPLAPPPGTAVSPRTTVSLDKLGRPVSLDKLDRRLKEIGKARRRINPLNPRALKRALRRAEGFEAFAKKTVNALYKTVDGRRVKTFKRTKRRSR